MATFTVSLGGTSVTHSGVTGKRLVSGTSYTTITSSSTSLLGKGTSGVEYYISQITLPLTCYMTSGTSSSNTFIMSCSILLSGTDSGGSQTGSSGPTTTAAFTGTITTSNKSATATFRPLNSPTTKEPYFKARTSGSSLTLSLTFSVNSGGKSNINLITNGTNATVTYEALPSSQTWSYKAGNYGTGTDFTQTRYTHSSYTVPDASFTREGYLQAGWDTNANGSNRVHALGVTIEPYTYLRLGTDRVLYPYWSQEHTATLLPNGGDTETRTITVARYVMPDDIQQSLLPTRSGYNFTGYFDAASGGTQYFDADGTAVKAWTTNADGTLYAQWEEAPSTSPVQIYDGNEWQAVPLKVYVNNSWQEAVVHIRKNNDWT